MLVHSVSSEQSGMQLLIKPSIVIVGAGLAGICAAIKLSEEGYDDIVILEQAEDVGGTWRDNHYPGAACDTEALLYAFSFASPRVWSKRHASWEELQSYIQKLVDEHGLRDRILLQQRLESAKFDERTGHWLLETRQRLKLRCRFMVLAMGLLHKPHIPQWHGLNRFKGHLFHSSTWDHRIDFATQRVVIVGTGASSVQFAPWVAARARHLTVLQRTPNWVLPRFDQDYGFWQQHILMRHAPARHLYALGQMALDEFHVHLNQTRSWRQSLQQLMRWRIRWQVKDSETARHLLPEDPLGCKPLLFSNDWYPMFNRSNVQLVTEGIRELTPDGLLTWEGSFISADTIILGTGFDSDPRLAWSDLRITGIGNQDLLQSWRIACSAYLGSVVHGFPNMFMLLGPNSVPAGRPFLRTVEAQIHWIIQCLRMNQQQHADYFQIRKEVQKRYEQNVQQALRSTVWQSSGCTSWYQDVRGHNFVLWPWSFWRFWLRTREADSADFLFHRIKGRSVVGLIRTERRILPRRLIPS